MTTQRNSPSGPAVPLARLAVTSPIAVTQNVQTPIIFDTLEIEEGNIGQFRSPPIGGAFSFIVGPGLYMLAMQLTVGNTEVTIDATLGIEWNAAEELAEIVTSGTRTTLVANVLVPAGRPFLVDDLYAGVAASIKVSGTNTTITDAELLIYKMR